MNRQDAGNSIELIPFEGWNGIRLGETDTSIRDALRAERISYNEGVVPLVWEIDDPWCTLAFVNAPVMRLAQITTSSSSFRILGESLVGKTLDEALSILKIQRFDDTVWSMGQVDMDFSTGWPMPDEDCRSLSIATELLRDGTLWIQSLGLGLTLRATRVRSISIRMEQFVPKKGYGPLDKALLSVAMEPNIEASLLEAEEESLGQKTRVQFPWKLLLIVATILTAGVLGWVIYTMVTDYQSWVHGREVVGKVVELKKDGLFIEELIVEYSTPDMQLFRSSIPSQYATAREIGEEVELVFRDSNPSIAMTRLQSRDHFSSLSTNWLVYTIPLLGLELVMLFPNLRRR